jgi:hypothetical protein
MYQIGKRRFFYKIPGALPENPKDFHGKAEKEVLFRNQI